MMKSFSFAAVTAFTLGACANAEPEPQADPRAIVQLVASLDEAAAPPPAVQEKLAKADRIVTAVDRSEPDRLAGAAERLLAK